jgi:hypothetical protein
MASAHSGRCQRTIVGDNCAECQRKWIDGAEQVYKIGRRQLNELLHRFRGIQTSTGSQQVVNTTCWGPVDDFMDASCNFRFFNSEPSCYQDSVFVSAHTRGWISGILLSKNISLSPSRRKIALQGQPSNTCCLPHDLTCLCCTN